jgi:hypothetical protein
VRAQGKTPPPSPESSGEDDKKEDEGRVEGEVTPLPHPPPREALGLLGDIFSRQAGITVSARRPK